MLPFPLHPFLEQRALDVEPQVPMQCSAYMYVTAVLLVSMACAVFHTLCILIYCNATTTYLTASLLP